MTMTNKTDLGRYITCSQCKTSVKESNYKKHQRKVHNKGNSVNAITGRTINDKTYNSLKNIKTFFMINDRVPLGIAKQLIEDSSYWYGHPCGHPVHAPKHYKRIQQGSYGWEIEFGANTFYIEKVLRTLIQKISIEMKHSNNKLKNIEYFKNIIRYSMQSSVSNHLGIFYDSYYIEKDGYMIFGTQAINANEFIKTILGYLGKSLDLNEKPRSVCEFYNKPDFKQVVLNKIVSIKNIIGRVTEIRGEVLILSETKSGLERSFDTSYFKNFCSIC